MIGGEVGSVENRIYYWNLCGSGGVGGGVGCVWRTEKSLGYGSAAGRAEGSSACGNRAGRESHMVLDQERRRR